MKYNGLNVGSTPTKMKKLHPEMVQLKTIGKTYFYDLSLLKTLPEEIQGEAMDEIIRQTCRTYGDIAIMNINRQYQYYIDADITRYSVYNSKGKQVYRIMELTGLRVVGYDISHCNTLPIFHEKYGHIRENICSYIEHIEVA